MSVGEAHAPLDGWDVHRRAELEGALTATPEQRLRWLEQAIVFASRTGALPRRDDDAPSVPTDGS